MSHSTAAFVDESLAAARQHVVAPLVDAAQRSSDYARESLHDAKDRISEQVTRAEQYASEQYDRTKHWVSGNPWSALGISFAVGLVLSRLIGSWKR